MQLVCFITAIFGNCYQKECLPFRQQTIPTNFICFTDNKDIIANGWHIDTHQYHSSYLNDSKDSNDITDSTRIVKYYKTKWCEIPVLECYDIIIWIDSNIEIISSYVSEIILDKIQKNKILCWHHPLRSGRLQLDAFISSRLQKYKNQDVMKQYNAYIDEGYDDKYFKCHHKCDKDTSDCLGVWLTNFIAFVAKNSDVIRFMNRWYQEIMQHTTQDRISFSYVCFKSDIIPYTLPDKDIYGIAHSSTQFYMVHDDVVTSLLFHA